MELLATIKLDTSGLEAGAARAAASLKGVAAASPGLPPAVATLPQGLGQIEPAAGKAVAGLRAVSAASGLLSGNVQGTASGAIALKSSLQSLGIASAVPIAAFAGMASALLLLAKTLWDAHQGAKRLKESLELGNAQARVGALGESYGRLARNLEAAAGFMKEMRALTREGAGVDTDKRLAQIELERKRELAALAPGDKDGAREVNSRFDRKRAGAELDREQADNSAAAAGIAKEREDNQKLIAARRQEADKLAADAARAREKAAEFEAKGQGKFLQKYAEGDYAKADEWSKAADDGAAAAQRAREEAEALERKNQILAEQASLYERRNEVVAIKREALGVPDQAEAEKKEKEKGYAAQAADFATDRLTRIGGMTNGGGASKMESLANGQLQEAKKANALLEKMIRRGFTATAG